MRRRGLEMPIMLLVRRWWFEDVPVEALDFMSATYSCRKRRPTSSPAISSVISRNMRGTLKTPFFGAMVDYAEEGNQMWTCPGHNGGVFYQESDRPHLR